MHIFPASVQKIFNVFAALFWIVLAIASLVRLPSTPALFLPMMLAALTAFRLFVRTAPQQNVPGQTQVIAWLAAIAPFLMQAGGISAYWLALQIFGLGIAFWALFTLGPAFGIAPADRGLVVRGPYRWVRHPAYAGELLALAGVALNSPSLAAAAWNVAIWAVLLAATFHRIRAEERVLAGYDAYAAQVKWRLMPGLW